MVLILLISMPLRAEWYGDARPLMGTEVSVWLWHEDEEEGQRLIDEVFYEASRINELMSTYIEDSRISEVNRNAAREPVYAGQELLMLVERALDISELRDGAFDITYDSVGLQYDFR